MLPKTSVLEAYIGMISTRMHRVLLPAAGSFCSSPQMPLPCSAMRAAPNFEMIAASLRSCSLGRTGGAGSPSVAPAPAEEEEEEELSEACDESSGGGGEVVTVELDSEAALPPPCNWEQRLESSTGEAYNIDRETGKRSLRDPRTGAYSSSYDSCSGVDGSRDDDDEDRESSVDSGSSGSSCISSLSSAAAVSSPGVTPAVAEPRDGVCDRCQVLVAAGCRSCFMYFMVPKNVDACPRCGDRLLHLGRHGCA